jgi:hypothetical protein
MQGSSAQSEEARGDAAGEVDMLSTSRSQAYR